MPESGNHPPPTQEEVQTVRNAINVHYSQFPDVFLPEDVERLMKDDYYVYRFVWHTATMPGPNRVSESVIQIQKVFKWRKETNPAGIKSSDISPILKETGNLYLYSKDCDGTPLLVLCVKRHHKGIDSMDSMKKLIHFYMEKVDRETKDGLMSLVIDCTGAGLRGLDMELIQYLITAFKEHYPFALNYILILEMPWILSAAWSVIKPLLPAAGVRKIRFLSKDNKSEYIPEDQQLSDWGGSLKWPFNFEDTLVPLN